MVRTRIHNNHNPPTVYYWRRTIPVARNPVIDTKPTERRSGSFRFLFRAISRRRGGSFQA
jgi:hypothetical protein